MFISILQDKKLEDIKEKLKDTDEYKKIKSVLSGMLDGSIVASDEASKDTLGKDLQEIMKLFVDKENRILLGHTLPEFIFYDSMLYSYAESIEEDENHKHLFKFICDFRFMYHTERSALKGNMNKAFSEIASALMGFRGAIEWREAGIRDTFQEQKSSSFIDRLRR